MVSLLYVLTTFCLTVNDVVDLADFKPQAVNSSVPTMFAQSNNSSVVRTKTGSFLGRLSLHNTAHYAAATYAAGQALLQHDIEKSLKQFFTTQVSCQQLQLKLQTFEQVDNQHSRWIFVQTLNQVPILGTVALAVVEENNVHYAQHRLIQPLQLDVTPKITIEAATTAALRYTNNFSRSQEIIDAPKLVILATSTIPQLVYQVGVATRYPFGRWDVLVDAKTGDVRARHLRNLDAVMGQVQAYSEPICQGDTLERTNVPYIQWTKGRATDSNGLFAAGDNMQEASVTLNGAYFRVASADTYKPVWRAKLQSYPKNNLVHLRGVPLSQIDPYIYANHAHSWLQERLAKLPDLKTTALFKFLQRQLVINVNIPSGRDNTVCNAFYDGQSLNFFAAYPSWGCINSGQSRTIVYHEYGHAVHQHLANDPSLFSADVAEGIADFFSVNITQEPKITGLLGCNRVLRSRSTLRNCANHYTYCKDSNRCDAYTNDEPHNIAPIVCGAFWDLKTNLQKNEGVAKGSQIMDQLFLRSLRYITDVDSLYQALIAADSDQDNDPRNGTDHSCAINAALFGDGQNWQRFPDLSQQQKVPCRKPPAPAARWF